MERTLENVHVVIYSKKMLKNAVKRLLKLEQNVEIDILSEYEFHGNDLLVCENGLFKVVNGIMDHPNHEITLNDLCEMVISQEGKPKHEIGKWYLLDKDSEFWQGKPTHNGLICCTGDGIGYGFNMVGIWMEKFHLFDHTPIIKEYSIEEVEKNLSVEARKRGLVKGVSFISPNGKYRYTAESNEFKFIIDDPTYQRLMIGDHAIMVNGKWAELLDYPKVKMGDYVVTSLKNQPVPGFSVYQLSIQNSVDVLIAPDTLYDFRIIDKEEFEILRKDALCGKQ
ncbi:MAG: hypothetical protein LBF27_25630 [Sphingobacterium sp.]|jgi:hypothetical protein|nr:hypothetical protein [Sphingobacterium sp.]